MILQRSLRRGCSSPTRPTVRCLPKMGPWIWHLGVKPTPRVELCQGPIEPQVVSVSPLGQPTSFDILGKLLPKRGQNVWERWRSSHSSGPMVVGTPVVCLLRRAHLMQADVLETSCTRARSARGHGHRALANKLPIHFGGPMTSMSGGYAPICPWRS